jgi:hypothetical protein
VSLPRLHGSGLKVRKNIGYIGATIYTRVFALQNSDQGYPHTKMVMQYEKRMDLKAIFLN